MSPTCVRMCLGVATAVAGILSAGCWVAAARASVPSVNTRGDGALVGGMIAATMPSGRRIDVIETLKKQSTWNGWAAWFAALTAALTAMSSLV